MTTMPSKRFIEWNLPYHNGRPVPAAGNHYFASWAKNQDTHHFKEDDKLRILLNLVGHVGFYMAPSRPVAKRDKPYLGAIPNAYKDPQIQAEFLRWAHSLEWTMERHMYARECPTLCSALAAPWLAAATKTNPVLEFGLQLALALKIDDFHATLSARPGMLAQQEELEECLRHIATLGLPLDANALTLASATDHLLEHTAKATPQHDVRPCIELFVPFPTIPDLSVRPSVARREQCAERDTFFQGAMQAFMACMHSPESTQTLALPDCFLAV